MSTTLTKQRSAAPDTKRRALITAAFCLLSGFLSGFILFVHGDTKDSRMVEEFWILWLPGILFGLAWGVPNLKGDYRFTFAVLSAFAYFCASRLQLQFLFRPWSGYLTSAIGAMLLVVALIAHGYQTDWRKVVILILAAIAIMFCFRPLDKALQVVLPEGWDATTKRINWSAMGVPMGANFALWQATLGALMVVLFHRRNTRRQKHLVQRTLSFLAGSKFVTAIGAIVTILSILNFFGKK